MYSANNQLLTITIGKKKIYKIINFIITNNSKVNHKIKSTKNEFTNWLKLQMFLQFGHKNI